MPDETMPSTDTPGSSRSRAPLHLTGALECGGAALVGVLVLVVTLTSGSWASTDFPRVAPEEMADRAFQRSQQACAVVGLKRTMEPEIEGIGVSTENTFGSSYCNVGSLQRLDDSTVDSAHSTSHR